MGFDDTLRARVRPVDWVNPSPTGRYNLVVVGAGTAGLVAAAGAAGLGAKVALIEKGLLGGDCLHTGCVPSKALLRSARIARLVAGAGDYGIGSGPVRVDFPAVMERMRRVRAELSQNDSAARFAELGVDVYLGTARFTGLDRLEVGGQELEFARACIASGSRPVRPEIAGLAEAGYRTNETLFDLQALPERIAIIGGGPIGCEMAQAFANFGSRVTLIERGPRILAHDDGDAAAIVQAALEADGVRFRFDAEVTRVRGGDVKVLEVQTGDATIEVEADEVLVGVGRAPVVEGLGLEAARVDWDLRQGILVDDGLRTSNPRIYAAGDVCLQQKFTHTADAAARIVLRNALFLGRGRKSRLVIPWCTYTDPELAHVGLTRDQAEAEGHRVVVEEVAFADVDRAVLDGTTEGFVRLLRREGRGQILGATVVGSHAGELVSRLTAAIVAGDSLAGFSDVIHPYPTRAEVMRKLGDRYQRGRLTPFVQRLFRWWLAWRRR